MGYRFNPPPNWPAPPPGWVPLPGWRPPAEWPAPPPGWQLWIDDMTPASNPVGGSGATSPPQASPRGHGVSHVPPRRRPRRRSSRKLNAFLLLCATIAVIVVIANALSSGSGNSPKSAAAATKKPPTSSATTGLTSRMRACIAASGKYSRALSAPSYTTPKGQRLASQLGNEVNSDCKGWSYGQVQQAETTGHMPGTQPAPATSASPAGCAQSHTCSGATAYALGQAFGEADETKQNNPAETVGESVSTWCQFAYGQGTGGALDGVPTNAGAVIDSTSGSSQWQAGCIAGYNSAAG
jgi:hypothetical protein